MEHSEALIVKKIVLQQTASRKHLKLYIQCLELVDV